MISIAAAPTRTFVQFNHYFVRVCALFRPSIEQLKQYTYLNEIEYFICGFEMLRTNAYKVDCIESSHRAKTKLFKIELNSIKFEVAVGIELREKNDNHWLT